MSDEDGLLPDFDLLAIKVSGGIIENAHRILLVCARPRRSRLATWRKSPRSLIAQFRIASAPPPRQWRERHRIPAQLRAAAGPSRTQQAERSVGKVFSILISCARLCVRLA